ncbi:MAG: DsbC family protein [Sideroxydans sp.]|jgi:thiol:disulfide interchange protein DsbC
MKKLLLLSLSLCAAFAQAAPNDTAALKQVLQQKHQQAIGPIDQVNTTPVTGLYEIVTSDHIYYSDESGRYLIDGKLFDMQDRRNITDARARHLFAIDISKLPLELALKKVKGNGKRTLITFEDPNCGYCKKMAQELEKIDNLTHYLFLFPIFEGSAELVRDISCSKQPFKAWDAWMLNGVKPSKGSCTTKTDQVVALGRKLKVNGTPALIFANGVINPGYLPADQLEQALTANQ